MRWKSIMYDAGRKENRKVENYGLKTLHSPKQVKELSERIDSRSQRH